MPQTKTPLRSATSHKRWEAKQDVLYRLDHPDHSHDPDHCDMRWADDGGRHVD